MNFLKLRCTKGGSCPSLARTNLKRLFLGIALLALFGLSSCSNEVVVIYDISQQRFYEMLQECETNRYPYLIIDIRTNEEYRLGHIDEAINYPAKVILGRTEEFIDYLNERIFIYGHTLDESFKIISQLVEVGFRKLYNVTGINEASYEFVQYSAIRLPQGFELAKNNDYGLIDYRASFARDQNYVAQTIFVPFPDLTIANIVPYAPGYVVFSTSKNQAKECAIELMNCGFDNIYFCLDNVINYNQYFSAKIDTEDVRTDEIEELRTNR